MPSDKVIIDLYHTTWCGHCTKFMPTWEKLVEKASKENIITNAHDGDKISEEEKAKVQGFPTILITINGEQHEFTGKRTLDGIFEFIADKSGKQSGGSGNKEDYYKLKYLKYKAKYLKKKSQLYE